MRVPVEVVEELPEDASVSAEDLVREIPRLKNAADKQPGAWAGFLRGAPRRWPAEDAEVVIAALRRAQVR